MDPVAKTTRASGGRSQRINGAGGVAGFLEQFPPASLGRVLAKFGQPCGQFPRESLKRGTILPYDRESPVRRQCNDGEGIELADGVINFRRFFGGKCHLARNEVDPWRD